MSNTLQPLEYGRILIAGIKASNLNEELRTHPRIILWDSQQEHWTNKDLPSNVRAVFMTRFIGHNEFSNIVKEARKRKITIFNPEGTGTIVRQVKELLNMIPKTEIPTEVKTEVKQMAPKSRLHPLIPFIDFSKNNTEGGRLLFEKAKELNIQTTSRSLSQFIRAQRKVQGLAPIIVKNRKTPVFRPKRTHKYVDVAVEILDNMVKELQDMRDYLVATTEENQLLKLRIERFKKVLDND